MRTAAILDREYPCPICHTLGCAHFVGMTDNCKTIFPRDGQAVEPATVQETDILFQTTETTCRVYRRAYSKRTKGVRT
jgi:hypothetical protein